MRCVGHSLILGVSARSPVRRRPIETLGFGPGTGVTFAAAHVRDEFGAEVGRISAEAAGQTQQTPGGVLQANGDIRDRFPCRIRLAACAALSAHQAKEFTQRE
jgi:hypothetical protein